MKRHILAILPVILLAVACTNNDTPNSGSDGNNDPLTESAFLCVNVMQPPQVSGRAKDPNFVNGSEEENKVNDIRFYIYDSDGLPISFVDWEATDNSSSAPDNPEDGNVEKLVHTAAFKIQWDNTRLPAQIACVVNPTEDIKRLGNISLAQLCELSDDFLTDLTSSNFLMSTSVYADIDSETNKHKVINTLKIDRSQLSVTLEDAVRNPLYMYVERVLARLDISFATGLQQSDHLPIGDNDNNITVPGQEPEEEVGEATETTVYVNFLGWAVTSTPKISRVLKSVDASWADSDFFSTSISWNSPTNSRSLWAINPVISDPVNEYEWFSYSQLVEKDDSKRNPLCHTAELDQTVTQYMQENASPYTTAASTAAHPKYPTKVIFAAQLVDENNEPLSIAEYDGNLYRLDGLKKQIAGNLDMYFEEKDNEGNIIKYSRISPEDLDFETSYEHGNDFGPDANDTYYVYFILSKSDVTKNKTWYRKFGNDVENDEDMEKYKISDPNAFLDSMLYPVKVWNEGRTYYFFDIPHCQEIEPTEPGHYGVVRNNIYNATIEKVTSLGTPVYRPDEVIYPEKPSQPGNQLIVNVKTVEWRLVRQSLQIAW